MKLRVVINGMLSTGEWVSIADEVVRLEKEEWSKGTPDRSATLQEKLRTEIKHIMETKHNMYIADSVIQVGGVTFHPVDFIVVKVLVHDWV